MTHTEAQAYAISTLVEALEDAVEAAQTAHAAWPGFPWQDLKEAIASTTYAKFLSFGCNTPQQP